MKKLIFIKGFLTLVVGACLLLSMGCASPQPPELSAVYDRFVYLIENATDVNTVFFGEGLPVYSRDGAEAQKQNMYYGAADDGNEYVKPYAMFLNIDEIKAAAEQVYCDEYLESLYESLFTGYTAEELGTVLLPKYSEDEKSLYQNSTVTPLTSGAKVYDYATMTILPDSTETTVRVEVEAYDESDADERFTLTLSFVYENGDWYLNSPC
ncbi:MAG: hypothetical protein E7589_03220 [Ruminococcaceae bacterium]|nr:hypothetical protein [Oscillospiraceae bacterium]